MKKLFTPLILLLLFNASSFAQLQIPNFNVTVNTGVLPGYFYFVPYNLPAYPTYPYGTQHHLIMDGKGHVMYSKTKEGYFSGDLKLHSNGQMSFAGDEQFYIMDSTFTIIDSVTTKNNIDFDFHDLIILPNKHYLLLGNENVTRDLSSYNMFNQVSDPGDANATVIAGVLQELDSAKNVVFEWHSIDNFTFDDVDEFFLNDPAMVDWTHMNSIEMDTDSNIIISSRHFDEITKINRSDSSIMWRLGGKRNDFNFINDSAMFLSQHDARRLPNGNLLMFDNGRGGSTFHKLAAKEYQLEEDSLIARLVWSHDEGDTVFSRSQGNCQRLSNGMTLISYGNPVQENIVFNVIDSMDNKVFEIAFPDSQITYRTFYYDSINIMDMQPMVNCDGDSLMADSGYATYNWSTGDTTQNIFVNVNDTFYVYVMVGDSGYISSDAFVVTDSANICSPVSVGEISRGSIVAYPNPANDYLYLRMQDRMPIDIFDITGRHVMHVGAQSEQFRLDISTLQNGVYIIRAGQYSISFVKS